MSNGKLIFAQLNACLVDGKKISLVDYTDEKDFNENFLDSVTSAFEIDEDGILDYVSVDIFRCPNASVTVLDSN